MEEDLWLPQMTDLTENQRLNLTISGFVLKKLTFWAKIHGKPPTTFAGQLLSTTVEANRDLINEQMQELARLEGVSIQELEKRWNEE
ncbi:MAG: hypothetical protein F6J86_15445 [Symploca sp. SIO1B1]|nr:hypothetical protein [Symploca sp. SIO1C2]NER50131.1 hypothetical protein [Symploca sp. SIO1A3]NER95206.1 hypothetical protein [Symploca sp. SIO1B1]NET58983.1 hypothetical protein [Symploca sp. SIO2E6]